MLSDYYQTLPKKRMGVGVLLFNKEGELLIVKPHYKDYWSIPGGVVDKDESLARGLMREIKEEIGLEINNLKFLCVDYIASDKEKDENLQFIFSSSTLSEQQIAQIKIDKKELSAFKFLNIKEVLPWLSKKLQKRLPHCLKALENNTAVYLENGQ